MENITVDVQRIMEEIKAEIAAKGLANDIPAFEDTLSPSDGFNASVDLSALKRELEYLRRHEVHYYRDITSYHPWLTPIVRFVKRVIRKLCKFLGEPMVDEINDYHKHITSALERTVKALEQQSMPASAPKMEAILENRKYKQLAEQYAASHFHMEKDMQALQQHIQQLNTQYEQLKLQIEHAELKANIAKAAAEKV